MTTCVSKYNKGVLSMTKKKTTKTQLATYENVVNELALNDREGFTVPMSKVFGAGALAKTESFGGRTLAENTAMVDHALANTAELETIWNRSHSQWDWKHLNLHYHGDFKNVRQISAEITRKKGALTEAKWKHVKSEIEVQKLQEQLLESNDLDRWEKIELQIELAEKQEGLAQGTLYIEGAMKDVLALNELYEEYKNKFDGFTEHDFELEESKSHLKRSLVQCIRDVRQSGSITKGEQEYMEQIGVNPGKMQMRIREFVQDEATSDCWDASLLHEFVNNVTNELIDVLGVDKIKMDLMGFDPDPNIALTHDRSVATRLENKSHD